MPFFRINNNILLSILLSALFWSLDLTLVVHPLLMLPFALVALMGTSVHAVPQLYPRASCAVIFDGRVPSTAGVSDFDTANGGGWNPFNPDYVKGEALSWSDIILLPETDSVSLFDTESSTTALEVTISDDSIFQTQNGFRRAGLQFLEDDNTASPASEGVVTIHFSVLQDETKPLNLSHEYLVSSTMLNPNQEHS